MHGDLLELPVRIALVSGLRLGEVLGLTWRALELPAQGAGKLTVSAIVSETAGNVTLEKQRAKTRSSLRTIIMDAVLMEALRAHRKAQAEQRLAMGPAWKHNDLVICTYAIPRSRSTTLVDRSHRCRRRPVFRLRRAYDAHFVHI